MAKKDKIQFLGDMYGNNRILMKYMHLKTAPA